MVCVSLSIDVPSLADGLHFYGDVLGFEKKAEEYPGGLVLRAGNVDVWLLEKASGSRPRHGTPVHLDVQVDDLAGTLARIEAAGATVEQFFAWDGSRPAIAFCSDPFGHGFCLLERER